MIKADGRCHSWRPGARPHTPRHEPGRCHRCWRPCWAKVPRDDLTVRCDECVEAILQLNTARLTRRLLDEPYVPERLSERLATDLDAGVALAASDRLAGRPVGTAATSAGTSSVARATAESTSAAWAELAVDATGDGLPAETVSAFDPTAESDPISAVPPAPVWEELAGPERSTVAPGDGRSVEPGNAAGSGEWNGW